MTGSASIAAGATNFFGVDQTTPYGSLTTGNGTGDPSLAVASAAGELVIDTASDRDVDSQSVGGGQTLLLTTKAGSAASDAWVGSSSEIGGASVTMSWTTTGGGAGEWAAVAVSLKPAASSANPVIANLAGDTLNYAPLSGAQLIDQGGNATVTDADSADFNGGTLTVSLISGSDPSEDVLAIRNQGTGVGQIGVSGANVTYNFGAGAVTIGTWAGGSGGANLVVTFNANANATAAQALIRTITYQDTDMVGATGGARTVRFVLTDGDGGVSAATDSTVSVTAGTPFILSGSYTGNGLDNRTITGLGFQPDVVIIKVRNDAKIAVIRTSTMVGDASKELDGGTALVANEIQSLNADGFTIGTNDKVNKSGRIYDYIAFKASPGFLTVGTYTGNGGASQAVTGVGFSPDALFVMSSDNKDPVFTNSAAGGNAFDFNNATNATWIPSLNVDGFTVGTDDRVNKAAIIYHYVAWNEIAGLLDIGSYTGNGVDNRNITGVGFQPEWVVVKNTAGDSAVQHFESQGVVTDSSSLFTANSFVTNRIQQLQADGFQVGKDNDVNAAGKTYTYMAWRSQAAPVIANLDSDALSYPPGSGALVLDQGGNATVTDTDSTDFAGGKLTVSFLSGNDPAKDILAVRNQGGGAGQIGVSGSNVLYGGTVIGTWSGGTGGTDLVITLNVNANPTNVTALVRNITFQNTDPLSPDPGPRLVDFVLTDGDGGTSARAEVIATVTNATPFILSGSYTGNGADNRSITGVGFAPDVVIVKARDDAKIAVIRTSSMVGDASKEMTGATALTNNQIQALLADGFQIGSDDTVNKSGNTYDWIAFKASGGFLNVGTYAGDDNSTLSVSGVGFSPEVVFVFSESNKDAVFTNSAAGGNAFDFDNGTNATWIPSLAADGFTVGGDDRVNKAGVTFHYVAWNEIPGLVDVGSYTGNGADNRDITGVGFQPEWVVVKNTAGDSVVQHFDSQGPTTDSSSLFKGATAVTNRIQALQSDGFQVGNDNDTNANAKIYTYMAFRQESAPTISNITDRSILEDGTTGPIAFTVGDNETAAGSLTVTAKSSNQSLVPNANIVLGGSGAARTITVTPAANQNGTVTISVTVNDGFASATDTFVLTVTSVNDAPQGADNTVTTPEDTAYVFETGDFALGDPNDNPENTLLAVKITTLPAAGTLALSGVPVTAGQFVSAAGITAGNLTFTPATNANGAGYTSFTFQVQDDGGTANGGVDLDPTPETMTVDVTAVNDAPVLDNTKSPALTAQNEDCGAPAGVVGTLVSSLVDFAVPAGQVDNVTDVDSGALLGIAVTAADTGNGSWWYSTDNGTNWYALGAVATNNARLLAADFNTRIYFQPNANYNGTLANAITFRAWDTTSGSNGALADTTTNGGTTAFSSTTDTASLVINAVNDAPVLDNTKSPALTAQNEDSGAPVGAVGTLVSILVDFAVPAGQVDNVTEVDNGALLGIAVTAADTSNGSWWYSTDNGTNWYALGAVATNNARLLAADVNTRIYFQPNANYNGTLVNAITFRAWDQTTGTNGTLADTTTNGGTTAFSTATDTASLVINAVNDAPVITSDGGGASASLSIAENSTAVTTVTSTDVDGGIPVYSLAGGADAAKFTINSSTGALSFIVAPDYENPTDVGGNNVYDVIVQVSDGNGGTDTQAVAVTVTNVADGIRVIPVSVVPIGGETLVNTTTANGQSIGANVAQAVATDGSGNYVVVWTSNLQDGSAYGIYAQRFSADGTAQGAEFLVNTTTADNQNNPGVAMDLAGNFVVAWASNLQDGSGNGVYAQRFNAAGVAQGGEFRVNTTTAGSQSGPAIAMSSSGAFVIAWTGGGQDPDASSGIYAQRFNASGVAQGGEFRVNTYTLNTQQLTSVAMDAAGNFVVTWASDGQDGSNYGVYGQRFDASGSAQGAEFRVNTTVVNSQLYHDVAMLPDGRFVVAYQSRNADNSFEVYMQRYATNGSTVGGETRVNTTTVSSAQQPIASVTADESGNITVVWNSAADGSGVGVVGRRFDWSGNALTGEFQVNSTTSGNQLYPEVVCQPGGGFMVAWGGNGSGDADGVFLQRYGLTTTEGGGIATFQIVLETAPTADVTIPVSVGDGTEGMVSVGSVTFNSGNWNLPQTVTITGLQDYVNDGSQRYQVVLGPATSADSNFNGLNPGDLSVTNLEIPNTAPVNTVPGIQTMNEDGTLVFSAGNGNQISIADTDAGSNALQVTLTGTNGTITLSGTTGLTFSVGDGTADATMTFTGTAANINTALNGLSFAPTANFNGGASLQIVTNDQGNTGTGGAQSDTDTVNITVNPVNDAPVLDNSGTMTLTTITEDATNNSGDSIFAIIASAGGDRITDVDTFPFEGIAVTSISSGNGTWQYSINGGGTWNDVGAVSDNSALLLRETDRLRFVPDGMNADSATVTFRAWDETAGAPGTKVDASVNGGTTAFSTATETATITVTAVNDAPTLDNSKSPTLSAQNEDSGAPVGVVGTLVSSLVDFAVPAGQVDNITDVDSGALLGIAVTAADTANGSWFYSINNGTNWNALGAVATNNARLLAADANTRIYFQPNANYNGTLATAITFRAWDQNSGSNGALADTTTNGGTTAFSTATDTASLVITAVNDAPTLADTALTVTVAEDAGAPSGAVGSLVSVFTGGISDVDSGAVKGIAITATNEANGTWYYSTNGGTNWTGVGAVSAAQSLLLADNASTRLYFAPAANYNGTSTSALTLRAWDQTSGAAGTKVDTSTNGGTTAFSSATDVIDVTVTAVNDASVLDNTKSPALTAQNEDSGAPVGAVGTLVSSLVDFAIPAGQVDNITDVDSGALLGIAVTAADTANGSWFYSINNGTNWNALGAVATNNARLLAADANTRIYFQPNANYNGTLASAITFRAWDQTSGSNGALADTTTNGGTTAFSSATDTASLVINAVNDAPVLADTALTITVAEDAGAPSGAVGSLVSAFTGGISDVDSGAVKGIAITATNEANGTWYYSTNGGTNWTGVGAVSAAQSLLLADNASTRLYFAPAANYNGTSTSALTLRAWDQTSGAAGTKVDTSTNGGTTAFSSATDVIDVTVTAVNDAPVLDNSKSPALSAQNEDSGAPSGAVGTLVSSLVDFASPAGQVDNVTDVDSGALLGIAVTAADTANGSWFYSINGGTNWNALGAVATNNARLLAADANTRIYFQPNANYNGTLATAITFRAWDQTSGSNGALADTTTNGGTTAFSSATDTASLVINAVNDAPTLADTALTITVAEDAGAPSGAVGSLVSAFTGGISDVDSGAVKGIAITATNETNGTWYYSTNGGTNWTGVGTVSAAQSLLLADNASTRLYFAPAANYNGTSTSALTLRAWDQTSGAAGTKVDTSTNGGTTAFSSATDVIDVTVTAVNDAPVLDNSKSPALSAQNEDSGAPVGVVGTLVSSLVDFAVPAGQVDNITDVDSGALLGIAVTAADTANGSWFYSINNGTNWNALGAVANNNARLLAADANTRIYFQPNANYNGTLATAITFRAWDQTSGSNGALADTTTNGGTTAFSSATDTASLVITAVNDAPVLADTALTITVAEDAGAPSGAVGSLLSAFTGGISDVDSGAVKGIAITATNETNGTWYYSTNGGTNWTGVGTVSAAQSLLLADNASTRLYFAPAANYNGTSTSALTLRAWDQTSGAAGTKVDTSSNGGTTAFSSATDVIDVTVTAVNDAPVLDNTKSPALTAQNEDSGTPVGAVGTLVSSLADFAVPAGQVDNITDVDSGALLGIAVTAADTANGSWFYSINNGTNWNALGAVANEQRPATRSGCQH